MQLQLARDLLDKAANNLASLQLVGSAAHPALETARKALTECTKATVLTEQLVRRIPTPDGWEKAR